MGFKGIFSRFRGDESGAIAIWIGFSTPMILGIGMLAFDMSNLYVTKSQLQVTADAAAIAAANALPDQAAAATAAQNYANLNMPSANHGAVIAPGDVVTGNWDPDSRVFTPAGSPVNAVQVSARRNQQNGNPVTTLITSMLGVASVNVSVSTIVAQSADNVCILVLDPGAARAVEVNGNTKFTPNDCAIDVNSSSTTAFDAGGKVQIRSVPAASTLSEGTVRKARASFTQRRPPAVIP